MLIKRGAVCKLASSVNLLPRLQCISQHSSVQISASKITRLYSVSVTNDGHSHLLRSNGQSSDLHIHLGNGISISFFLSSSQSASTSSLWQWFISEQTLPRTVSDRILMHQLQLVHNENAVTNQSSAVHAKDLVAVQFHLQ